MNSRALIPALLILAAGAAASAPRYDATFFPVAAGEAREIYLNERGDLAYRIQDGEVLRGYYQAAGGAAVEIPGLGGNGARPAAMNNAGVVVGSSGNLGFVYEGGVTTSIGSVNQNFSWVEATGINNAGVIVAAETTVGSGARIFRRQNGTNTDLGILEGSRSSTPAGINDSGLIVGYAATGGGGSQPQTILHAIRSGEQGFVDLGGSPFGSNTFAVAVNNRGDILASGGAPTTTIVWPQYPYLIRGGVAVPLVAESSPGCEAKAINDRGTVVGLFTYRDRAALFPGGAAVDLNGLTNGLGGYTLVAANDVNNREQIVGSATTAAGGQAFFRLDPAAPRVSIDNKAGRTRRSEVTIRGRVAGYVNEVASRSAGSRWRTQLTGERWRATVRLRPGRNVFTVQAAGPRGVATKRIVFQRRVR